GGDVVLGDGGCDHEHDVVGAGCAQRLGGLARECDVRAGEDAEPHDLHVFLDGNGRDRLGPLADPEVDHLESRVAQCAGDELRTAVVPVETRLGDEHAHGHQNTAGCWNSPHRSFSTSTISPTVQ